MDSANPTVFKIVSLKKQVNELSAEHVKELDAKLETLSFLDIQGNSYSKDFCQQLGAKLGGASRLERLNLNDIFVGRLKNEIPEAIEFLATAFVAKPLRAIDFSNNAVNPFGATAFSIYLNQAATLRVLHINNCGLGPQGVEIIAQSLAKGAPNLEVLSIARNRAEDLGLSAIGLALPSFPAFRELHVQQDVGREPGMAVLLENIKNCARLEVLDIQDNFLKGKAAEEMALVIKQCKNLKALNVSDCNITEDENDLLIAALQVKKTKSSAKHPPRKHSCIYPPNRFISINGRPPL